MAAVKTIHTYCVQVDRDCGGFSNIRVLPSIIQLRCSAQDIFGTTKDKPIWRAPKLTKLYFTDLMAAFGQVIKIHILNLKTFLDPQTPPEKQIWRKHQIST